MKQKTENRENNDTIIINLRIAAKWLIVFSIFFQSKVSSAQDQLFQTGDRVCFIGNSITMNGKYFKYLELFYATRFPDRKILFYNCGISGDDAGGMLRRLNSDVFIHKPTKAVLMVGMNDVRSSLYKKETLNDPASKQKKENALQDYYKNVDSIVRLLMQYGCKVILQTPTIYDQTSTIHEENHFGVNDALKKCADFLEKLARKYSLPIVDYWDILGKVNSEIQKKDPAATIIGHDRVHPGDEGHFIMAYQFLIMQDAPKYVSYILLRARSVRVIKTQNCTIENLQLRNDTILFQCMESSLPFPLPSGHFNPDSLVRFTQRFNNEILQVKALKKGRYKLLIDSVLVGEYQAKEIRKGINLAKSMKAPQNLQAINVLNQLQDYWELSRHSRQIKYVEYQFLRGDNFPEFTEEKAKERFGKVLERYSNQPKDYVDYYKQNFDEYLINKPSEKEYEQDAIISFNKVYEMNKPVSHQFRLIRM